LTRDNGRSSDGVSLNFVFEEWSGIREVCRKLNIDRANMNRHLNGKVKTLKNSKFLKEQLCKL
jgi:DNA-binding transcriptional regulator WhiA